MHPALAIDWNTLHKVSLTEMDEYTDLLYFAILNAQNEESVPE